MGAADNALFTGGSGGSKGGRSGISCDKAVSELSSRPEELSVILWDIVWDTGPSLCVRSNSLNQSMMRAERNIIGLLQVQTSFGSPLIVSLWLSSNMAYYLCNYQG